MSTKLQMEFRSQWENVADQLLLNLIGLSNKIVRKQIDLLHKSPSVGDGAQESAVLESSPQRGQSRSIFCV